MIQKQGNWVPYELKPRNVERRFFTCEMLLARHKRKGFLHRIVTGDEKWIYYDNLKKRKSQGPSDHALTSTAKPNIHRKKLTLCIWWDQLGVVYYELLKSNETITGALYRTQLMRLSRAFKEKRAHYYSMTKLFSCMIMLDHMLRRRSKPTQKHSNGKFYPTRRILQTLLFPTITCSDR